MEHFIKISVKGKEFTFGIEADEDLNEYTDAICVGKVDPGVLARNGGKAVTHDVNIFTYGSRKIKLALYLLTLDSIGEITIGKVCFKGQVKILEINHPQVEQLPSGFFIKKEFWVEE